MSEVTKEIHVRCLKTFMLGDRYRPGRPNAGGIIFYPGDIAKLCYVMKGRTELVHLSGDTTSMQPKYERVSVRVVEQVWEEISPLEALAMAAGD